MFRPWIARTIGSSSQFWVLPRRRQDLVRFIALSLLPFCFSPLLQFQGLKWSRASDNAVIVAMEPLLTAGLGWFFLKERPKRIDLAGLGLALVGFSILSTGAADFSASMGNALLLVALLGEATYSVLGRNLIAKYEVVPLFGTTLTLGVLGLTLFLSVNGMAFGLDWPSHTSLRSLLGILWMGPIGTTLTYVFWLKALTRVDVAQAAPTLFVQPVMGVVWGVVFLGEALTGVRALGAGIILVGILTPTVFFPPSKKPL